LPLFLVKGLPFSFYPAKGGKRKKEKKSWLCRKAAVPNYMPSFESSGQRVNWTKAMFADAGKMCKVW